MDDEINLKEYWIIFKKNIWLILIIFLIIFGASFAYTYTTDPVYESRSVVVIESNNPLTELMGRRSPAIDMNTQEVIIKSSSVLYPALGDLNRNNYELEINTVRDSNAIEIIGRSSQPATAREVANSVARSYISYSSRARRQEAGQVRNFITEQIETLDNELAQLNSKLENEEIKNIKEEIAMLETQNNTPFVERQLQSLRLELEEAEEEINKTAIEQQISAKEELYNTLLSRREEVGIMAQENAANIQIVQSASYPFEPVSPNKPVNLAVGFLLGIMAGAGVAFGKEYMRGVYLTPEQVEEDFGVVMGRLNKNKQLKKVYKHKTGIEKPSEEVKHLRSNIQFYMQDNNSKVLAVTSADDNSGKSVLAARLARDFAKSGKKVLLIDANLRNPSQHHLFSRRVKPGLTDVLEDKNKFKDSVVKVNFVELLTAGTPTDIPTELLSSHRMQTILRELAKSKYDVVLLDTSSLDYAETCSVAQDTAGVVMLVGLDKTNREKANEAKKKLERFRIPLAGVVVQ